MEFVELHHVQVHKLGPSAYEFNRQINCAHEIERVAVGPRLNVGVEQVENGVDGAQQSVRFACLA